MATTRSVAPSDLLIDEQNPRISQPHAGQGQALTTLAQRLEQTLLALARDIVEHGLDPSNLMIVMPVPDSPTQYVVLEGNRRLAALRALENPESITAGVSVSTINALRRLSRQYRVEPIAAVNCVIVSDRAAARHWIDLRHTGPNQGVGVMYWKSDEADVFRGGRREVSLARPPNRHDHHPPRAADSIEVAAAYGRHARSLSKREVEVLELVIEGCRNKDVADSLAISQETVRVHLRTIFAKLGVHDRAAAAKVAPRRGIVHLK